MGSSWETHPRGGKLIGSSFPTVVLIPTVGSLFQLGQFVLDCLF